MAKRYKKAVPDEDVKEVITENNKTSPKKGASVKVLGAIIKPLSETKDKTDEAALEDSSLRAPIEALLLHEYAKHEINEHGSESEKDMVCAIKDLLCGVQRENSDFLKCRDKFEKDLGVVSSILTDILPKGSNIRSLIARALFGKKDYDRHESEYGPKSYDKPLKESSAEVLNLLK